MAFSGGAIVSNPDPCRALIVVSALTKETQHVGEALIVSLAFGHCLCTAIVRLRQGYVSAPARLFAINLAHSILLVRLRPYTPVLEARSIRRTP